MPAYEMGNVEQKQIAKASRRAAVDDWLAAPWGDTAAQEQAVLHYLTS